MCQISSLMAASEGLEAEYSSFAHFEERKRKLNFLMSFLKILHQKCSFGQIRKKSVISLVSADSRYFRSYALKIEENGLKSSFWFLFAMLVIDPAQNLVKYKR